MSKQLISDSLRLFLNDLASVRVEKKVSLDDIQAVTKVYPHIIAQFEEDGLQDHHLFNDLYVRAFVRSYAKVLGLSQDETADAYDSALHGKYRRQLAIAHLGLDPSEFPYDEESEAEEASPLREKQPDASEPALETETWSSRVVFKPASQEVGRERADTGPVWLLPIREGIQKLVETAREHGALQWGILIGGIGIGLIVILQLLSLNGSNGEPSQSETTPGQNQTGDPMHDGQESGRDTVPLTSTRTPIPNNPPKPVVLSDSLEVFVVASTGKLDPFRVKIDNDLRRPYWLDQGDSMRFYISERLVVEDNLDAMQILLEGFSYPIYETDSLSRVVIDRDSAQAFLSVRYQ